MEFKRLEPFLAGGDVHDIIDLGSGLCSAPQFFKSILPQARIACLDSNMDLVALAKKQGFEAVQGNVIDLPFADDSFDVVHCSHVIEHLDYPAVTQALDEFFVFVGQVAR